MLRPTRYSSFATVAVVAVCAMMITSTMALHHYPAKPHMDVSAVLNELKAAPMLGGAVPHPADLAARHPEPMGTRHPHGHARPPYPPMPCVTDADCQTSNGGVEYADLCYTATCESSVCVRAEKTYVVNTDPATATSMDSELAALGLCGGAMCSLASGTWSVWRKVDMHNRYACRTPTCDPSVGNVVFEQVVCEPYANDTVCLVPVCTEHSGGCTGIPLQCDGSNPCVTTICHSSTATCEYVPKDCGCDETGHLLEEGVPNPDVLCGCNPGSGACWNGIPPPGWRPPPHPHHPHPPHPYPPPPYPPGYEDVDDTIPAIPAYPGTTAAEFPMQPPRAHAPIGIYITGIAMALVSLGTVAVLMLVCMTRSPRPSQV